MSFSAATQILLESTFATGWAASGVAVAYPNVPFKQPPDEFVRFSILAGMSEQISLGESKLERRFGVVVVQIFTPKNSGNLRANELADAAASIFRYKQLVNAGAGLTVNMRAPNTVPAGSRPDYYQVNMTVPFEANAYFS